MSNKPLKEVDVVALYEHIHPPRPDIATLIIEKAGEQAKELNYTLEEALGDVMGGLLYEVDAVIRHQRKGKLPACKDSAFYIHFISAVKGWFM